MNSRKVCVVCGRRFAWRKKWARNWNQVRYCSGACRHRGLNALDRHLETELLDFLARRPEGSSVCPSELARRLAPDETQWRALMEPIRMAARRLYHIGKVTILQSARHVDPDTARGPIRLRLASDNDRARFKDKN